MGKIYIQLPDGTRIHLPVLGASINTADNPAIPDMGLLNTVIHNRCYSGQYTVDMPPFGNVTFLFDPPGRTGTCNQCGQCCSHPAAGCGGNCGYIVYETYHICQHLTIKARGIGKSNGTECSLYQTLLESYKGCVLFPEKASDILSCPACGFSFS